MKKVMIGILILIPILILAIVVAVSNFLQMNAWIAVDNIKLVDKATGEEAESVTVVFPSEERVHNLNDFIDIEITPDYANRYTIEWRLSDLDCMDSVYDNSYKQYLEDLEVYNAYFAKLGEINNELRRLEDETAQAAKQLEKEIEKINADDFIFDKAERIAQLKKEAAEKQAPRDAEMKRLTDERNKLGTAPELVVVEPPAMFVDENGKEVTTNTTGKFVINSYCRFTVIVQVESISKSFSVTAEGYNVEDITIVNVGEDTNTLSVGESMRVDAKYNPMTSIVTDTIWSSDNPEVATVDANGIITAHKVGKANITVKANKSDNPTEYVESEAYEVEVVGGVSKFGSVINISKKQFTLADIGLSVHDVDVTKNSGCEIRNDGIVDMTADAARITTVNGDVITVNICGENDIAIENADIYDATNAFVFAVSDLPLTLKAVWKDVLKDGLPEDVQWETSDSKIATVADGVVRAVSSGLVQITASTKDGSVAQLILNVQIKVVSMNLRTSNNNLAVGLALETVFAAEKYTDDTLTAKTPNSTFIQIVGAPQKEAGDSDAAYEAKLRVFYSMYKFEIISGGEYAYFENIEDNPAVYPNKLTFIPSALEGKGKQKVVVKVSAKYPKYESETRFTTETVDINVIYGVEVSNIAQLRKATDEQKTYAYQDGNLQPREVTWEHINPNIVHPGGIVERYRTYSAAYSLKTYAVCFAGDIAFEVYNDGTFLPITDGNSIHIYGDLYGNGYMLGAERDQIVDVNAMLWIAWSNTTVSNLTIRANRMEKGGTLSVSDTKGLQGECLQVFGSEDNSFTSRTLNVRIEYCILENARRAGQAYNADMTFDGVIVRNIDSVAFYMPARMKNYVDTDGQWTAYPIYPHLAFNNCVFANCISTTGSYAYERFTVMPKAGHSDDPFNDYTVGQGRFIRNDLAANAEYFRKNFVSAGINIQIRQTGFLDIYNWQDVRNANIIDTGDSSTNQLIGTAAGSVIGSNSIFAPSRYYDELENTWYYHMGFISTGISFGEGIFNEPVYLDVTFEDDRFAPVLDTTKIKLEGDNPIATGAETALQKMTINFYGYRNDADITPFSVYEINTEFIKRLHS